MKVFLFSKNLRKLHAPQTQNDPGSPFLQDDSRDRSFRDRSFPRGSPWVNCYPLPFRGRLGSLRLDSRPRCTAIASTQSGAPNGRFRTTEARTAVRKLSWPFTRVGQSTGRSIGHRDNCTPQSFRVDLDRLDQGHSSARAESLARRGFCSTYRQTVRKCESV